jgi:hypothetical protein
MNNSAIHLMERKKLTKYLNYSSNKTNSKKNEYSNENIVFFEQNYENDRIK